MILKMRKLKDKQPIMTALDKHRMLNMQILIT